MSEKNGRFEKGNTVGEGTRFQKGNTFSSKYRAEYGLKMLDYFRNEDVLYPTFEMFAESIGVLADTLRNWREEYPRFRHYYDRCKNIQKGRTIQGGMIGKYNSQIVKFMAINNFDMSEKTVGDSTVTLQVSLPPEIDEESN